MSETPVNCQSAHTVAGASLHVIHCDLGLFGGHPSSSVCARCQDRKPIDPDKPAVLVEVNVVKRMPAASALSPEQHRDAVEAAEKAMAIPRSDWPLAVKALAAFSGPQDKGIGDVVERHLGVVGEAWKAMYEKLTNQKCGCEDRKRKLNLLYPLP